MKSWKSTVKERLGPLMYGRRSYAQEGEDLVVDRMMDGCNDGFYVDVGCHHPFRFSNTYLFYRKGWRGICIDALPGTAALFRRWRPRDQVLETGVGEEKATLTYHMFNEPALNTFDPAVVARHDGLRSYRVTGTRQVPVEPLAAILGRLGVERRIDFMSVDVEGFDLSVLRSNDWRKYRPKMIIAECAAATLDELQGDPVKVFLHERGYQVHAKTGRSVIFIEESALVQPLGGDSR